MLKRIPRRIQIAAAAVAALIVIYFIPPIHDRLAWRIVDARLQVRNFFSPPAEALFLPTQQAAIDAIVKATMEAHATAEAVIPTPRVTGTRPGPTARPTTTSTPLPRTVALPGVKYVDQRERWNYCAPANLTMALNFWGWKFLIEAVTLSLFGGAIGVIVGIVGARLTTVIAGWPTIISFDAFMTAFVFSLGVGLFFGLYPANKAARLNPIEALRYE